MPLAERFDGTTWSAVPPTPALGDADTQLFGITCLNTSYCVAAGSYLDPAPRVGKALVERWNGSSWTLVPAANGSGNLGTELDGAFCNSTTDCYAFGVSMGTNSTSPIFEHWNGSVWSLVSVPLPAGVGGRFHGIACASATACFLVGESITTGPRGSRLRSRAPVTARRGRCKPSHRHGWRELGVQRDSVHVADILHRGRLRRFQDTRRTLERFVMGDRGHAEPQARQERT